MCHDEKSPVFNVMKKSRWIGDLIGFVTFNKKVSKSNSWNLCSPDETMKIAKTLGVSHLIIEPKAFISAQEVIFSGNLDVYENLPHIVFPTDEGNDFVEVDLNLVQ